MWAGEANYDTADVDERRIAIVNFYCDSSSDFNFHAGAADCNRAADFYRNADCDRHRDTQTNRDSHPNRIVVDTRSPTDSNRQGSINRLQLQLKRVGL